MMMECEEEETPETHEGKGVGAETGLPLVQIVPIPVQPETSGLPLTSSPLKSAGVLGFRVNGQLVHQPPGGGGTELKLCLHPGGSATGFTSVQVPVTVTLHSPVGRRHIAATVTSSTPGPTPTPTPIITGVVSGEAAQKVLSAHNVSFQSSSPPTGPETPPPAVVSPSRFTKMSPGDKPAAPPEPQLLKGLSLSPLSSYELGPPCPPACLVCSSQYRLITELRGFMCLCSPAIAQSLRNLKRAPPKRCRRRRDKRKLCTKSLRTRGAGPPASEVISPPARTHRTPDDLLSDRIVGPAPRGPPQPDRSRLLADPPQGKLVILVEDFYYGSAPGHSVATATQQGAKFSGPYHCIHCPVMLRNNIQLMQHMQQHVSSRSQQDRAVDAVSSGSQQDRAVDTVSSCPHCFRRFLSPFRLQCHLEAVHSQCESTVTCRICELAFGSEPAFLWHMKTTHKPGEMPYACQVCGFRSSFHADVWNHFQDAHANTRHLMCQYCLRVLRSNTCYQQHFTRHQKKHVLSCDKCRLHFLYVKERVEHKVLDHRTHTTPAQLSGLRPGTKVTVRTYSVVGGPDPPKNLKKSVAPCKVVHVAPPPPPSHDAPKRKPVQSLGDLLSQLSRDRACGTSRRCIECLNTVPDFRSHFPSLVHCSLCRFVTCCSTSYANHMIGNHASYRKNTQYQTMFQSQPSLMQTLRCVSCSFSTCRGDMMSNHLTERPGHTCVMLRGTEQEVNGAETHTSDSGGGAFIPIHLLPTRLSSAQLSVKPLTSPSPLSSPAAMTIKFLGPRPPPGQSPMRPLLVSQLAVVLSSLCHGVTRAALRHRVPANTIRGWMERQRRSLASRRWCWRTDKMAEWVLSRREQQLTVSEDVLLETARGALGGHAQLADCYNWSVDFLLRHELQLDHGGGKLPRSLRELSHMFLQEVWRQVQDHLGCMDELPIFMDWDQFSNQDPCALQLFGSPEDSPVLDVVLSALSDGSFLRPLLFFTGTVSVPDGFPDNVVLEARRDGFTERDRLHTWIHKVWRPHVAARGDVGSHLMVDPHRGHLEDGFRDAMSSVSTELVFLPAGCSNRLQPLHVCVTPTLRDYLQVRWSQLVSDGGLDGLGLDQLALTLACWLSEVASTLNSERDFLRRSFSWVLDQQQAEDPGEVARMTSALTDALIRPPETRPGSGPGAQQVKLLLVMKEKVKQEEEEMEAEPEEEEEPTALRQVFDSESSQDSCHGFHDD